MKSKKEDHKKIKKRIVGRMSLMTLIAYVPLFAFIYWIGLEKIIKSGSYINSEQYLIAYILLADGVAHLIVLCISFVLLIICMMNIYTKIFEDLRKLKV